MHYLIVVTFIWAFSFSFIGVYLAGHVDGYIAVAIRMLLALIVFLPFLRLNALSLISSLKLVAIGAVQIGVMYLCFYHSFLYLSVAEVLLFTIFTPIYVTLLDALFAKKSPGSRWLIPAIISVIGAAVIRYKGIDSNFITGFVLVQSANLCFAFGQVVYKRTQLGSRKQQLQHFFFFFLGASIIALIAAFLFADWNKTPQNLTQVSVLIWLGVVASGLGYFLWNYGAKKVNAGQLATMNNALLPAGLLVNLLIWERGIDWIPFIIGSSLILISVWMCSWRKIR
ncbi:EamA family transporter [Aliikangiella sp. IMCC44653]